ncbi:MAG: hypothetical protein H6700_07210 [Myxococcales bacterium]|nr:hypothetical protein [Myxococcales bacterium]MCB9520614.1 hypothetical protein [Myxococcales bacterium]MCB9531537.1 hypothetical protein [Myxococcales bacterium]
MSDDTALALYDIAGAPACAVSVHEGDVQFADPEVRWTWVLDARHAPYDGLSLREVLERAAHAHKRYALVGRTAEA